MTVQADTRRVRHWSARCGSTDRLVFGPDGNLYITDEFWQGRAATTADGAFMDNFVPSDDHVNQPQFLVFSRTFQSRRPSLSRDWWFGFVSAQRCVRIIP